MTKYRNSMELSLLIIIQILEFCGKLLFKILCRIKNLEFPYRSSNLLDFSINEVLLVKSQ